MRKLSTGEDSTLGNWKELAIAFFGEDSPQVEFLQNKIDEFGEDDEVIADEAQLLMVLVSLSE